MKSSWPEPTSGCYAGDGYLMVSNEFDYFMARHYQEGAEVIDIEVDPSEWAKEKPSDWLRFPDACALALLRYDALQAAGFSVGETG